MTFNTTELSLEQKYMTKVQEVQEDPFCPNMRTQDGVWLVDIT